MYELIVPEVIRGRGRRRWHIVDEVTHLGFGFVVDNNVHFLKTFFKMNKKFKHGN